jgi:hypothetical protein
MGGAGPSAPGHSSAEGLIVSFSLFYLLLCFGVSEVSWSAFFFGSSVDTLSGWAEHLHALYMETGG